jgi:hypothetical protein
MVLRVSKEIAEKIVNVKSEKQSAIQTASSLTDIERELIHLYLIYHKEVIGEITDKICNWQTKKETVADYFFYELQDIENNLSNSFNAMYLFAKNCHENDYDFSQNAMHFLENSEVKELLMECLAYNSDAFSSSVIDSISDAITHLKIEIVRNVLTENSLKQLQSSDIVEKTLLIEEQNRINQILEGLESIIC